MPADQPTVPMRGCEREWAQARAALDRAGRGEQVVLVIEGAPGSGRSRLLQELAAAARARGSPVFERQGWLTPALVAQVGKECEWLAGQLGRLRTAIPVVVAWDDPRWVDRKATLPGLPAMPVLWALTRPAGDSRVPDPLEWLAVIGIELHPLPAKAVAEMLADLLGATPSEELLALAPAASGNPGAIVDLVDGLREDGLVSVERGVARLASVALPRRTLLRVRRQLARVSPQTRRLVQVASAVGQSISLDDLADLMRDTAAGLLPAVEEALDSGLFACADERLAFGHELVRRAVSESVPRSVRRSLWAEADRLATRAKMGPATRGPVSPPGRTGESGRGWHSLTSAERTVAALVGQALTNRQIAAQVYLSPHTVNYHLRQIFRKLDIHSRVELVRIVQTQLVRQGVSQAS